MSAIKVLVIDDSSVIRNIIKDALSLAVTVYQKNHQLSNSLTKQENKKGEAPVLPFSRVERNTHIIAVVASTGGTEAIKQRLQNFTENSPPIVITQHIPKIFSLSFAKRLKELCSMQVHEATYGQKIKQGHVYIVPGDMSLEVVHKNGAQGMLGLKNQRARTLIQDKISSLIWMMLGKSHAIDAHTQKSPLNKIVKSLLDYAALNRDGMKEVLYDLQ